MLYGGLKTLRFTMAELLFLSLYFELTMMMMVDEKAVGASFAPQIAKVHYPTNGGIWQGNC